MPAKGKKKALAHKKVEIEEIKTNAKLFLEDRTHSNKIVDIISLSESESIDVILASIRAFHRIFNHLISNEGMYMRKAPETEEDIQDLSNEDAYRWWLRQRYLDAVDRLIELLNHENDNVQELSLCTLMKFVAAEGQTPIRYVSPKHLSFPVSLFDRILLTLVSSEHDMKTLITRFQEFLEYDDVRFYVMKILLRELKEKPNTESMDILLSNMFTLLDSMQFPEPTDTEDSKLDKMMSKLPESGSNLKITNYKEHKKLFTTLWLEFLRKKLSSSLYKKVLIILHEKVMPHLSSPLLLSDFLTESYNIGGAISLLALNGLFILIQKHNLDYPDFYKKLYALFEPTIFHVKYRARFFYLSDLFLTSTHLPAYLVAAFIKKLSRLSLTTPPSGLMVLLPFIYNLIIRHPSCKVLVHQPKPASDVTSDPFSMEEEDPAKCKAMESSLWEIKTLQNHYHHEVATLSKKINNPLPKQESPIADVLETTVDELFEKEVKRKIKDMPVTFQPPKGLFGNKGDQFSDYWHLE